MSFSPNLHAVFGTPAGGANLAIGTYAKKVSVAEYPLVEFQWCRDGAPTGTAEASITIYGSLLPIGDLRLQSEDPATNSFWADLTPYGGVFQALPGDTRRSDVLCISRSALSTILVVHDVTIALNGYSFFVRGQT